MYELVQIGEETYYINCPSKVGVYKVTENEVYLIDSGNDKDAGKKILKVINDQGWTPVGIINTHSHADHVGGNNLIQQRTGCNILLSGVENAFAAYPVLEPSLLYGGFPPKMLRNKFLMAQPSSPTEAEKDLPPGLEAVKLEGHYLDMIGIRTSDGVFFIADSLLSEEIILKYHIAFLYDVRAFMETLDALEQTQARIFVPSHAPVSDDIKSLVRLNRDKMLEIMELLCDICRQGRIFEDILADIFDKYSLRMDFNQYVLVGSTIRSYLAYLTDENKIEPIFEKNYLFWRTKQA